MKRRLEGIVSFTVARPSVRNLAINSDRVSAEDRRCESWGWVEIGELAECIRAQFKAKGVAWPKDKNEFSKNFFFGSFGACFYRPHHHEKPLYTWSNGCGVTLEGDLPFGSEWFLEIFIPASVSNGILSLVAQDIVSVALERLPIPSGPPYCRLVATRHDGVRFIAHATDSREGSFRLEDYFEFVQGG